VHEIAFKCLANPSQPREYWLALYMSCLGALKYRNLNEHQKYFLYLTAGFIAGLL
jgi:rhamnogalacturonyl hydrolase YesR